MSHTSLSLSEAQLPELLSDNITAFVADFAPALLTKGREDLTHRYKPLAHTDTAQLATKQVATKAQVSNLSSVEQAAYLLTRMPATYAVLKALLQQAIQIAPDLCASLKSVVDLGAGPGTTLWAIAETLPHLTQATNMEHHLSWIHIGKQLTRKATSALFQEALWQQTDLRSAPVLPHADLIVCSYMLGELPSDALPTMLTRAWEATDKLLLLVEPGTPAGFERMRIARDHLVQQGGFIVAPCPHAGKCPMKGSNWCHFGQKTLRSHLHKTLKSGTLAYEEEKYSYLLVSKTALKTPEARVLRPPRKRSKHVHLSLCTRNGLSAPILSARNTELYKLAKDVQWGDAFEERPREKS